MTEIKSVLLGCWSMDGLTGSEWYFYELAKWLREQKIRVYFITRGNGPLKQDLEDWHGVKFIDIDKVKGHELRDKSFTVAHLSHYQVVENVSRELLCPIVQTIHSEVIPTLERRHPMADVVIGVRDTIPCDVIIENMIDKTKILYSGKKATKFLLPNTMLWLGTVDDLRKNAYQEAQNMAIELGMHFSHIGKNRLNGHDTSSDNPWYYLKSCAMTAGIFVGRITVEGWMLGKPGLVFDVNEEGEVLSKSIMHTPSIDVLKNYDRSRVGPKIMNVYQMAITRKKELASLD